MRKKKKTERLLLPWRTLSSSHLNLGPSFCWAHTPPLSLGCTQLALGALDKRTYPGFHPKFFVSCSPPLLPDILRKFNRYLTGYAVGTGDANDTNAFLNQAVPGAKAEYGIGGRGSMGNGVGGI